MPRKAAAHGPSENPRQFSRELVLEISVALLHRDTFSERNQLRSPPDSVVTAADAWFVVAAQPQLELRQIGKRPTIR